MKDILINEDKVQDLGIINGKVYIDGVFVATHIYVKNGKISSITKDKMKCKKEVDAKGCMVLPGFIDPHVHFNLLVGERVSKDDFHTGSSKGALGGITTYIDFLDPIKKAEELEEAFCKRLLQAKKSVTDYAFHTTIANPLDNADKMIQASKQVGITSIKLFTTYSDTNRRTKDSYIYELLACSKEEDIQVVVHAENDELVWNRKDILVKEHEKSRPVISEGIEIMKLAMMARETKGNLYLVHVSAGSSVKWLVEQFSKELKTQKIRIESCPHYFIFDCSVYEQEDGYQYTMTPPLRAKSEKELLHQYIDFISTIGTDHCPCEEAFKKQSYTSQIFMGIGGIEYSFLNMYTLFQQTIIDKFTKEPAKAYGLYPKKGCILTGSDADLVLFDPNASTTIQEKESIYNKMTRKGAIKEVYLRGQLLVKEGKVYPVAGRYLRR